MKIIIIQTAYLGDVILITPLIRATRELYPHAQIDVMVIPQTASALRNNPHLNNIIEFDKRRNKLASFVKTLRKLRKEKYDIAITPHSSMTTALLIYYAGIPMRIGFNRWRAAKYLTHKVPHLKGVHKSVKNLELLSVLTDKKFPNQTELFPSEEDYRKTEKSLADLKARAKKIIAIAPGSVWFTKRWPAEYYAELSQKLTERGYGVALIGSAEERKLCEEVMPRDMAINLAGELSVLQSAAAIAQCDLTICNDSGVLHISNAMQTDVFAFFGPTVQTIGYFPFRENDFVFEREMDCRPCGSHGGKACPLGHHDCMRKIYPDEVLRKVIEKFGE